ncbi:MAG TPA: site-specific integrase [Nanoarchaeota archaeon]|nr:site-specific integrase [Candidatus Woesearchaeota archaeon]HIH15678.1 site-specific integrase [Nanoarchaeota archaeon]HIH59333.1 site-specific integrase [Nanoarchaeota archaeon]HII13589.1 site-specific integrase [Nanoarchaeota archaeon]HIJ04790.1 site-specific integrase [Nanoarchaeota archaeon]
MAENDIYGSKERYVQLVERLVNFTKKPRKGKYYCKNYENLKYFQVMISYFNLKDLSYIRRRKVFQVMRFITFILEKDLAECTRENINDLVSYSHTVYKTVHSKKDFIKDLKSIWCIILPEKDHYGRVDETLIPYTVRHVSGTVDKSKEKLRNDRITYEEFKKIITFFSGNSTLQAYLTLVFESLGRPQEILYTKIKDYEFYDSYAKVWISEHGKEGTGFLQCIDSYPYIAQWYREHPFRQNPQTYFFLSKSNNGKYTQLKNSAINFRLRQACKHLGIQKQVTCYSLKRNDITYRRLRGDSDMQIQHAARWTSTKQLKIYDMSTQQDALQIELERRGIQDTKPVHEEWKPKVCGFCGCDNGFTAELCVTCKRPLDRKKLQDMAEAHERFMNSEMMQKFDQMEKMIQKMVKKS